MNRYPWWKYMILGVALVIGLPIGIAMSRSDHFQRFASPVLDVMQTMPSFVYLIPVVMLLGIGRVPGLQQGTHHAHLDGTLSATTGQHPHRLVTKRTAHHHHLPTQR